MKILLSAYSCLPTHGSEPAVGWNWARSIAANGHEVFVLTRTVGRPAIEKYLETQPVKNVRFIFHDLPPALVALYRLPMGNYLYYTLWQYTAADVAHRLHRSVQFHSVQHITWASFRAPSFMGRLGIPFTFGPVGGGEDTPPNLRRGLGWRGRIWDALRRFSGSVMSLWMRSTYQSAAEIIAATQETAAAIPARYRHKIWSHPSIGVAPELVAEQHRQALAEPRRDSSRLELLFVGRLVPWKGLHLILKALARLGAGAADIHLTVVGIGSDLVRLQRLARRLNLDKSVSWSGWMDREGLIQAYPKFDLFTFPSLHDSGGMVVLEAMSFGLPVLCLDLGGPAMTVNDQCGCVIATGDRSEEAVVEAIARFLGAMLVDREKLAALSDAARRQAASLTWQANVDAVYKEPLVSSASSMEGAFCAEA